MAEATFDDVQNAKKATTMAQTDRKCPQCGATMDFDPETGGMFCPYCEYKEEIPAQNSEGEEIAQELDFEKAEFTGNCDWGAAKKTVTCKSCGAVSVYDALEVANECPYCGSNQVMEAQDVNTLAPNGIIPFAITAKKAGENFGAWLSRKWFAPKAAKRNASAESFKGIYLPYWTFDANTSSDYTGEYGINRTEGEGEKQHTVTDWHKTKGHFDHFIDDELVAATGDQNTRILQTAEPYKTNEAKAYKPEYLAGFMAERYSVGLKDAWEKAKQLIKNKVEGLINSKILTDNDADLVRNLKVNTVISNVKYKYVLLPVWLSCFQYNGKTYQFVVNGQSGKVGGDYPVSPWRVLLAILICVGIIALIAYLSR